MTMILSDSVFHSVYWRKAADQLYPRLTLNAGLAYPYLKRRKRIYCFRAPLFKGQAGVGGSGSVRRRFGGGPRLGRAGGMGA